MQNPSEKQVYLLADISSMLYDSTKLKNVRKYATMTTKMVFHGSDIEKICSYYHLNKEDIIKFGANVNPLGLSSNVREALASHIDLFSSYPDRNYTTLRNTISEYCHIPADFILPGNGSSELISLLIQEKAPKHTLILGPTYSEYSRELSFSGSTQEYYHLREEQDFCLDVDDLCQTLADNYDFLILCNPNNPTSSAIFQEELRKLLTFCSNHDIFVMIDETYVEFAPEIDKITAVPLTREFSNLMVLRGVSKFYAAPGMRLGYGITGNLILSEREKLYRELKEIPTYKVYPAYANFILLKIQKPGLTSFDVFEACIKQGLMIRDCASFQCLEGEFIRFCIMMPEDNARLLNVLKQL